ncbi:hypothetical protein NC796_06785 [Aliifodinibius sp. S!AR15-10]|uniref:hypothetical protein n=1 Tax=Aliifodinibius sp. S!AR15-10 TaxID=2950437 RepID=UPI0028583075|nr:hypothetical protein [Aliifodinibius sp. S!AR15-10]MDR8390834.1 hypothetical protein [Aliifodinibius sp. S!AR15-10]
MAKRKVSTSEQNVLGRLVFPESFETVLNETGLQYGELRDDLINLMSFGYIEAYEKKGNKIALTSFYDADNLQDFTFRATKKGLSEIRGSRQ